jgi:diguanylate cyclase (GGDEF)-like protein
MDNVKKETSTPVIFERFWTVTNFNDSKLNIFARDILKKETQTGIQLMTLVFFCLLVMAALLDHFVGLGGPTSYAYLVLAALCLHVLLASRHFQELDVLYLLAISLLMISSTTLILLAHKSGTFSPTFFAGVALIYIFIPFVPWGIREASLVSLLIYLVITLSILSSNHHFSSDSIILLQFFMLSIALIILTMVGKNSDVRRKEIMGLFSLQKSHAEMQLLSYRDPLTDIWNRRYLQEKFYQIASRFRQLKKPLYFVLFDLDDFKQINDINGHDYGDRILQWTAESFGRYLDHEDYFFRVGGDEFAFILSNEPLQFLQSGLSELCKEVEKIGKIGHGGVSISFGMNTLLPGEQAELREIYKKTDKALYASKRHKGSWLVAGDVSAPDLDQSMNNTGGAASAPGEKGEPVKLF